MNYNSPFSALLLVLTSCLLLAATPSYGSLSVTYGFEGPTAAEKVEPTSTTRGLRAEDIAEQGDIDDGQAGGLSNFRGNTLFIKDNPVNRFLDDGESSLIMEVVQVDGRPLQLESLALQFGGVDGQLWSYAVFVNSGEGEREVLERNFVPAGELAHARAVHDLSGTDPGSTIRVRVEFADDNDNPNAYYTLRLDELELVFAGGASRKVALEAEEPDREEPVINEFRPLRPNRPEVDRKLLGADSSLPNVILIYVDDLGYGTLGCYGGDGPATPHIDRMASEGLRFTDAYCSTSACTPSRYSLMQGEYAGRGPTGPNVIGNKGLILDTGRTTLPEVFQRAGYVTAGFGKWNLGLGPGANTRDTDFSEPLSPGTGESGFDYFFGIPVMHAFPPLVYFENDRIWNADPQDPLVWHNRGEPGRPVFTGAAKSRLSQPYVTSEFNRRLLHFIRDNADRRFFIFYPMTNPHTSFEPHPSYRDGGAWGLYGDYIEEMDAAVGSILGTLASEGLAEETLVIFTSDNGGIDPRHGLIDHLNIDPNAPLKGNKGDVLEGGLRVPFIVRWPGQAPAGETSGQPLQFNDLLATFASLTGQPLAPADARDSFDLLPALRGESGLHPGRALLFQGRGGFHAIRVGDWKYINTRGTGDHPHGMDTGSYEGSGPDAQLYNLAEDPHETTNLISTEPGRAAELQAAMEAVLNRAQTRTAATRNSYEPETLANR